MRTGKAGGGGRNGLLPNSLKIISSCLRNVSKNASSVVRSAGASIAAAPSDDEKEQVLWAGFDKLELGPSAIRNVLLIGYSSGFQVVDVEDASNVCELVSKRDGPVTFLQMQPIPEKSEAHEGFMSSQPLLLVVGGDESNNLGLVQVPHLNGSIRDNVTESQPGNGGLTPTVVRFYSLRSDSYVHVLRFRSTVYLIRSSPRIIAVALASQIYCFDAITLENKFSVLSYPIPQGGQGLGINIGYGPLAIGPRWLAYASNNPLMPNTGRLSPQNLTPSPGVSPSTSPSNGSLMARYAVESSKQIAAGLINLGDMSYRTLSKYCHELLPDGSNSHVLSTSNWKVNRVTSSAHSAENDNAGVVVVKDFVSKAIISQFRAHSSPISALCFDPSGTLLVTTSVHGNNINVFRIMPSHTQSGSSSGRYDWSVSHVHLYKLYRGLTTAVIQDICFSHYSQWVAIVSSKGTCHIYALSPFGGDVGFQTQSFHNEGPILSPNLSLPWWASSSCNINRQSPLPPAPITLSVVSRIKNSSTGWLNTVTNVTASATGKVSVPSGALAATFHNSLIQKQHVKANSLEHILVYSPSGHVVQHQLLPSIGLESSDFSLKISPSHFQDDELRVNAEPVQCWDVCRRSNWPEREGGLLGINFDKSESEDLVMDGSDYEDNDAASSTKSFSNGTVGKDLVKYHERPHWYLSNAEVQINSGSIPIWQKSKIYFYTLGSSKTNERVFSNDYTGGEIEVEKVPVHEVEIKRRDLLPVFEHFQCGQSDWSDRTRVDGRCSIALSSEADQTKDKFMEETYSVLAKPRILGEDSVHVGSSRPHGDLLDMNQANSLQRTLLTQRSGLLRYCTNQTDVKQGADCLISPKCSKQDSTSLSESFNSGKDSCPVNTLSYLESGSMLIGEQSITKALGITSLSLVSEMDSDISVVSTSNRSASGILAENEPLKFSQYFHEGYCKVAELDDCRDLPDIATDADSTSSHCEREKSEGDGEQDDMLGGIFAFCEEG